MQRCNPIADFGGTNGKASRQTDAFCFLEYLPGFPNAKKTYQTQMHPIWDDIVLLHSLISLCNSSTYGCKKHTFSIPFTLTYMVGVIFDHIHTKPLIQTHTHPC